MPHEDSILDSTKRALGLAPTYDVFDPEIIMHINTVFMKLQQLGIGPPEGFMIEDTTPTWADYLGDNLQLNAVMTYMTLSVKMVFDPPGTSFLMTSYEKQISEYEFRLMVQQETAFSGAPVVVTNPIPGEIDGGGADAE